MFIIGMTSLAIVMTVAAVHQFRGLLAELREVRALCQQIERENKIRQDEEKQAGR